MASYKITFKSSVEKDLRKLDKAQLEKIMTVIQELSSNPFPINSRKLVGSEKTYRVRVGDYRTVYIVSTADLVIEIQKVAHRKDIYR
jgi:mRNA interferase RelE/StbE